MPKPSKARETAKRLGFRSGLEEQIAAKLRAAGVEADYESVTLSYTKPSKASRYTPDFPLPNGILVESKGRFVTADRQKHKLLAEQHPDLDLRFVFSNSRQRISKVSKTTYAKWCESNGFLYADKLIPQEWLDEPPCPKRIAAIKAALYER